MKIELEEFGSLYVSDELEFDNTISIQICCIDQASCNLSIEDLKKLIAHLQSIQLPRETSYEKV